MGMFRRHRPSLLEGIASLLMAVLGAALALTVVWLIVEPRREPVDIDMFVE